MTVSAAQLLKQLEPAVRPGAIAPPLIKPSSAFESQSFEHLLALASNGALRSGRQIELSIEPSPPLDASQLERLAAAADQAQAAGARQALMVIDGRAFVLDVESRTITAELSETNSAQVFNLDAAMFVAAGESESQSGPLPPPGNQMMPLIRQRHAT